MAVVAGDRWANIDEQTYKRRIRAWTMYDWANSAFATTIMAALLPAYYSGVAGATLPTEATATAYWGLTGGFSLFIVALLSPILGTISDVMRGKKLFLSIFVTIGVIGTGLMVFVNTGDWFLASVLFIFGRIGFAGANVFYDSLLPHIAKPDDQDSVSARGFAIGYLGGGLLLAVNVAMFLFIPDSLFENAGVRLSFLTVAIWWAVFSIPIFRRVPEPPSDSVALKDGESVIGVSWQRLKKVYGEVRQFPELFKYLIAFLIFNDAINTIIGMATIYGAELRFGLVELVLALLLVQFVGIPFSLIFGRLPARKDQRRHIYLAFIIYNLVVLPTMGIIGSQALPREIVGQEPPAFETTDTHYGEGLYTVDGDAIVRLGTWDDVIITGEDQAGEGFLASLTGIPDDVTYIQSDANDASITFALNGQDFAVRHDVGPDRGVLAVLVDGEALTIEEEDEEGLIAEIPVVIDMYAGSLRYNEITEVILEEPITGTITLQQAEANLESTGNVIGITSIEVLPAARENSLPIIIGALFGLQALGVVFALAFGRFFKGFANMLDTRRSILLALCIYGVIAVWGFILNSTIEFWFLAWMVAIVQGGSQALSRSLYASLSPASKSGEFFGLFSIMSKMAAIVGPLLFAGAVALFGSSRPAILSLIALFAIGGFLLTRVNIEAGMKAAQEADAKVFGTSNTAEASTSS
jgi:UMF1 family MFS transporter